MLKGKQTTEHSEDSCSSRNLSYLYAAPTAARFPSLAVVSFEISQIRKTLNRGRGEGEREHKME
jgi:hypothetical protein